MTEWSNFKYS